MSNLELKVADKIKATMKPSQYIDWSYITSKVKAKNLYRVWDLMIQEGLLVQGYANIKNSPRYRLG
ncbi:hypothetical protein M0R04_14450 [Candidatus Dojkabacteria bacterium]|jgi:hypothetical protein|nr:hypothetical protein [Candidatus Dojkabacteria bacterium]